MRSLVVLVASFLFACSQAPVVVSLDGSSTVFPISEAVAEEFNAAQSSHKALVGVSGTGGGFKKFCKGEVQVIGASRGVKDKEVKMCASNGVELKQLSVAFDGITVVVHPENTWVNDISVEDLKMIWRPESQNKLMYWSDINKHWPHEKIVLFGPGVDSGTYDYFTKVIVGKSHSSRGDFVSSEDDNVLVQGVSTDKYALGFFGFAYYKENRAKLKALAVNGVAPTFDNIKSGAYKPLSRPLFIYINPLKLDVVRPFVEFYLNKAKDLSAEVGYIPLGDAAYSEQIKSLK